MKEFRFYPTEEFEWWADGPDGSRYLVGRYVPGNTYNCTADERHDALREKCKEWEARGCIQVIALMPGQKFIINQVEVE